MKLNIERIKNIKIIKEKTGNATDITYKDFPVDNNIITFVYSNSVSDAFYINDFILKNLDYNKNNINSNNIFNYIKNYIPNNVIKEIYDINETLYYLLNGFTIILFDNINTALAFENKANINSPIIRSENEKNLKGPSDAFTENYQSNIGMLRRRLKTENLWFKECIVGKKSKTKVALFYLNEVADTKIVNNIYNKIKNINIDYVGNINYILESISNTNRTILPTNLSTERPDFACQLLLQGRIVLMVENSNEVIILPCMFIDFFKNPNDYYEKNINVFANRLIRIIAMILAVLTPAIYISLMAYNIEALPNGLLINFSIQRDGVPFTTVFEILIMSLMFQILRESDLRFSGKGSSSISIVGALVLGQAAVEAGIVSPITIIIVGISSVASLSFSSIELINSIRWWQLFLIILSALFGFIGVIFGCIIILALLLSNYSLGVPYFKPLEPFNKYWQNDALILKNKIKFHPKNIYDKENVNNENK